MTTTSQHHYHIQAAPRRLCPSFPPGERLAMWMLPVAGATLMSVVATRRPQLALFGVGVLVGVCFYVFLQQKLWKIRKIGELECGCTNCLQRLVGWGYTTRDKWPEQQKLLPIINTRVLKTFRREDDEQFTADEDGALVVVESSLGYMEAGHTQRNACADHMATLLRGPYRDTSEILFHKPRWLQCTKTQAEKISFLGHLSGVTTQISEPLEGQAQAELVIKLAKSLTLETAVKTAKAATGANGERRQAGV